MKFDRSQEGADSMRCIAATHDLDALDIVQRERKIVPVDTTERRVVHRPSVDQTCA